MYECSQFEIELYFQKEEPEYDYILDEEIDFVQTLQMPGTRKDKVWFIQYIINRKGKHNSSIFCLNVYTQSIYIHFQINTLRVGGRN